MTEEQVWELFCAKLPARESITTNQFEALFAGAGYTGRTPSLYAQRWVKHFAEQEEGGLVKVRKGLYRFWGKQDD